jgi:hypothetical protein
LFKYKKKYNTLKSQSGNETNDNFVNKLFETEHYDNDDFDMTGGACNNGFVNSLFETENNNDDMNGGGWLDSILGKKSAVKPVEQKVIEKPVEQKSENIGFIQHDISQSIERNKEQLKGVNYDEMIKNMQLMGPETPRQGSEVQHGSGWLDSLFGKKNTEIPMGQKSSEKPLEQKSSEKNGFISHDINESFHGDKEQIKRDYDALIKNMEKTAPESPRHKETQIGGIKFLNDLFGISKKNEETKNKQPEQPIQPKQKKDTSDPFMELSTSESESESKQYQQQKQQLHGGYSKWLNNLLSVDGY